MKRYLLELFVNGEMIKKQRYASYESIQEKIDRWVWHMEDGTIIQISQNICDNWFLVAKVSKKTWIDKLSK